MMKKRRMALQISSVLALLLLVGFAPVRTDVDELQEAGTSPKLMIAAAKEKAGLP